MKVFLILVSVFVLMAGSVNAIGVAQEYLEDNTLYIAAGTTRIFTITLQNNNPEPIDVNFILESEIATITDKQEKYTIPAEYYDMQIKIELIIPINARLGQEYLVSYSVQPLASSNGGNIPINLRINKGFKVVVVDEHYQTEQRRVQTNSAPAVPQKEKIKYSLPKIHFNDYVTGALIGGGTVVILVVVVVVLWKRSKLLSAKVVKKQRNAKVVKKQRKPKVVKKGKKKR